MGGYSWPRQGYQGGIGESMHSIALIKFIPRWNRARPFPSKPKYMAWYKRNHDSHWVTTLWNWQITKLKIVDSCSMIPIRLIQSLVKSLAQGHGIFGFSFQHSTILPFQVFQQTVDKRSSLFSSRCPLSWCLSFFLSVFFSYMRGRWNLHIHLFQKGKQEKSLSPGQYWYRWSCQLFRLHSFGKLFMSWADLVEFG